ncbi:MAG: MBL fold metallo-hydrolase [bacterium]|nr:MBL fold metallo-hydrolase [bacterium]
MVEMIQPVQRGTQLLSDIDNTQVQPGQVAIWWLGQSGYAIKTASTLVYIDLYLSESLSEQTSGGVEHIRMTEAPLRGNEITNAGWVFSSHGHPDHFDGATLLPLMTASPNAKLILPASEAESAVKAGIAHERQLPMRGNDTLQVGGLTVHALPSAHPNFDHKAESGYPYLGYVLQGDGVTLYHTGDTIRYVGLAEKVKPYNVDVAFLPINGAVGQKVEINTAPNMDAQTAVEFGQQIGAKLVIPHHYDLFTYNTVDVNDFTGLAASAGLPYRVLHPGEKFVWSRGQ